MNLAQLVQRSSKEAKKIETKYFVREPGTTRLLFENLDLLFSEEDLEEIEERWIDGQSLIKISKDFERDPDEIFSALFEIARSMKNKKRSFRFDPMQVWRDLVEIN